jgi:NADPH2:quinone reductase
MACLAYNGRYLMMGFASDKKVADEKLVVPRRIALGNLKLCGVLLAYAHDDMARMLKQGMGWSFASHELGAKITRAVVELVLAKKVRPVIGKVIGFEALPQAMEDMAERRTVGRTIVELATSI